MGKINYYDVQQFVHDGDLQRLLCIFREFDALSDELLRDDFLLIDESLKIPFFAVTRDYVGAREKTVQILYGSSSRYRAMIYSIQKWPQSAIFSIFIAIHRPLP